MKHQQGSNKSASSEEIDRVLNSPGSKALGITPSKKKKEKKRTTSLLDVSDEGLGNPSDVKNDAADVDRVLDSPKSKATCITPSKKKKEKKRTSALDASVEGLGNPPAEIDGSIENPESKAVATSGRKKKEKKRRVSVLEHSNQENYDTTLKDGAINHEDNPLNTEEVREEGTEYTEEPTMEEKLASLNLLQEDKLINISTPEATPAPMKPPSADSMHVLLKQALHAEDNVLLLSCLQIRDEKVITKSISHLNPADAIKLLKSLLSLIESRGMILICVIAWLRSLLSQHTSNIMSQESSLPILNSLYQLIESRVSTYGSVVQLSTYIDYLFGEGSDNGNDEETDPPPVIYEDKDSEEEEYEDAMETDDEENEGLGDVIHASNDPDGSESDIMSD